VRNPPFQVDPFRPWLPSNLPRTRRDPVSNSLGRITKAGHPSILQGAIRFTS